VYCIITDLSVEICGVKLKNPVIAASGTFGFGREYNEFYDISNLGGIAVKVLTLRERAVNPPPRVAETPSGMLNSIGLQNPGVEAFIENDLRWLKQKNIAIIANIAGACINDYCKMAERLSQTDVGMIELNISCPNVKEGGIAFGSSAKTAGEITREVKKYCTKPLIVKLSPNVTDITEIALAVEAAGADAVSLINTLIGMRIDVKTRRPVLRQNIGGLSGPAIFPVALRMVWETAKCVKIPVIGMGGIADADSAVQMLLAGAGAVQVGTANFTDPYTMMKIISDLREYCEENHIASINDIVGGVMPN